MRLSSSTCFIYTLIYTASIVYADSSPSNTTTASPKAVSLNLTQTWTAPIPPSIISPASDYIGSNWFSTKGFYGASDVSFVQDPFTNTSISSNSTSSNSTSSSSNNSTSSSNLVVNVVYPLGSYAPVGTKNGNSGIIGGAEFFSQPVSYTDGGFNTALLSYDLAFDPSFNWVKGGKLPGIYGGPPGIGCSGGSKATGDNCFSVRLMWRDGGAGEAYAYIPTSTNLCKSSQVICNSDYGTSFSRGVIRFSTSTWTHIDIYMKLNTDTNTNGILQVWQDGSLMINQQHIQFRANNSVGITSMMFSTFFGGGTPDYATQIDTSTYFKNIQFSVGNTPDPTQGNSASSLYGGSSLFSILVASLVVLYQYYL